MMPFLLIFLAFLSSVTAQFSMTQGFSESFNQYFENLSNESQGNRAVKALLNLTASNIKKAAKYQMPFELNCTVVYDAKVNRVDCVHQFENISFFHNTCEGYPELTASEKKYSEQQSLFQARMWVGISKLQMLQATYWVRPKRTVTQTGSLASLTDSVDSPSESCSLSSMGNCLGNSTGLMFTWSQISGIYSNPTSQASRYTNPASGVVLDGLTGLQWEQAASSPTMNWSAAGTYCAGRNTGSLSNWRLPNVDELQTLVDYTTSSPSINSAAFPSTPSNYFWTSTIYQPSPTNAWIIDFRNGVVVSLDVSNDCFVRCVR
jgi:hypothetical protein